MARVRYVVFISSRSLKKREHSFAQFVLLGKCVSFSIFEWWNLQLCFFSQKIYKLSKTIVLRELRGDKNQIFRTLPYFKTLFTNCRLMGDAPNFASKLKYLRKNGHGIFFWPSMRKNCSSDREKHLKIEAEGQKFPKIL